MPKFDQQDTSSHWESFVIGCGNKIRRYVDYLLDLTPVALDRNCNVSIDIHAFYDDNPVILLMSEPDRAHKMK